MLTLGSDGLKWGEVSFNCWEAGEAWFCFSVVKIGRLLVEWGENSHLICISSKVRASLSHAARKLKTFNPKSWLGQASFEK